MLYLEKAAEAYPPPPSTLTNQVQATLCCKVGEVCRFVVCGLSNLHAQRFLHKGKDKGEAVASPRNPARTVFFSQEVPGGAALKKAPPWDLGPEHPSTSTFNPPAHLKGS